MFWRISVRLNLGIIYSFFTTCCGIKIGLVLYPKSCLSFKLIWLTCPIYQLWLTACDSSLLILWYAQVIHHIGNSNSYRSLFACGAWFSGVDLSTIILALPLTPEYYCCYYSNTCYYLACSAVSSSRAILLEVS